MHKSFKQGILPVEIAKNRKLITYYWKPPLKTANLIIAIKCPAHPTKKIHD